MALFVLLGLLAGGSGHVAAAENAEVTMAERDVERTGTPASCLVLQRTDSDVAPVRIRANESTVGVHVSRDANYEVVCPRPSA